MSEPEARISSAPSPVSTSPVSESTTPQPSAAARSTPRSLTWWVSFLGIIAIHVATVVAIARGVTLKLALLCAATYFVRMFAITAVYHRYFSHRAYKTSRPFQFFLALLGVTATQKGPLWWASTHRVHHRESDTENDVHSPLRRGLAYAHMGWWLGREHENTEEHLIRDFARYPEIAWLDRYHLVGPALLMLVCWLVAGADGILWGYVVSTCVLMHATFTINSLSHVFGSRRYATTDTSRNNPWLALLTMGEGWHNNHHHYMSSANQGFYWYEIDMSFYALKILEKLGLVWDLRKVPAHVLERNLLVDVGERCELLLPKAKPVPTKIVEAEADVPPIVTGLADAE